MNSEELKVTKKERQYARSRVTRIYNTVTQNVESLDEIQKAEFVSSLGEMRSELRDIDRRVHRLSPDDEDVNAMLEEEENYRYKITVALASLQPQRDAPGGGGAARNLEAQSTKLKLPMIDLPTFSNEKSQSLEQFFHALESILSKHGLSEYEKFVYLKSQVKKGPSALINSLDPGEQTYAVAKKLLSDAFASPLTQSYDTIKRLCRLKLSPGSDVYEFIGEMRSIISSFKLLNITVDTILQYFVWHALNDKFQEQLIQITNQSKPSLDEITKNIFSATDRYLKMTEKTCDNKSKVFNVNCSESRKKEYPIQTNNLAIDVKHKNMKLCPLCAADNKKVDHVLRECNAYATSEEKVRKLESLNYCGKCSFRNHKTVDCRFKFSSPCRSCSGAHLTCLCTSSLKSNPNAANSYSSLVHFSAALGADNVILPTFTLPIIGKSERVVKCRILSDTGSQRNFISAKIAKLLALSIVKRDVDLVIYGFNSEKRIRTDVVEFNVLINQVKHTIEAIIVPSININLDVANIGIIARNFSEKGYQLADQTYLNSHNSPIDLVMGPDAIRILCPETVNYSKSNKNPIYMRTKLGVMLLGDIDSYMNSLYSLPIVCLSNATAGDITATPDDNIVSRDSREHYQMSCITDVMDETGKVNLTKLEYAKDSALEQESNMLLNYDRINESPENNEINDEIVNYVLSNIDRTDDGRLIMPLPWNPDCKHLLGQNYNLSKKILYSNLKKLKDGEKLTMYDQVFKEQEQLGIIERIGNIGEFRINHPDCSFLPHMGVFRMNKDTTKCRVVYLSNLCEKNATQPNAVSHNNALLPGPCLNNKLTTALMFSRFDKFILIFDIKKAFLNIQLRESDQNRLLFLWFDNVDRNNFEIVVYRNRRLSFGLRPSPAILMLALYWMLIMDVDNDNYDLMKLKMQVYANIYMDNGLVSSNNAIEIENFYEQLPGIFENYKFELQQFVTSLDSLQDRIDVENNERTEDSVKFFGMKWNRSDDTIGPYPIHLDINASTKRSILSSLNSVYDLFNYYGPVINRAKIFFHKLQCRKDLEWDRVLDSDQLNEWKRICREANKTPHIAHARYFGPRCSDYDLVAFCDASSVSYGVVIYIRECKSQNVSFLIAKNRIVNTKLTRQSIPSLECQGVAYAIEVLMDIVTELSGSKCVLPISIKNLYVYTDSMVVISWVKSFFIGHDKMQKRSVFVQNRLKNIAESLNDKSVTLRYIEGKENPADYISRPTSYNRLRNSNYFTGPDFLKQMPSQLDIEIEIPSVQSKKDPGSSTTCRSSLVDENKVTHLVDINKYSSWMKLVRIYRYVLVFISRLKRGMTNGFPTGNLHAVAVQHLVRIEQVRFFGPVKDFFQSREVPVSKIPDLILQMNLFLDENSLIRVKSKFSSGPFPVLLPDSSYVTELVIRDLHERFCHAGVYTVTSELRKQFWVIKGFSTVRRVLKNCVTCKKVNERPIKLNQNSYRSFRSDPPKTPFASVFLDYIGPINIKIQGKIRKVWLLIITCLWSRAISLKICFSADTKEFLRSIQLHIYEYGLFQFCMSDLGSQLVAGVNVITNFLDDPVCSDFLQSHGINRILYDQYPKGNSTLGALVENCVKQVKSLIIKTIGKLVIDYPDFQLLIAKTTHIVNRRPVAFKESLHSSSHVDSVTPITPEMLLFGRELISVNVIPQMQSDHEIDYVYSPESIRDDFCKLTVANKRLVDIYSDEFLVKLISQAIDKKDRYKPVSHKHLSVGDIVLLVEPNTKRSNFPLGIVKVVNVNSLGEVVSALVMKGKNREVVFRHSTSMILLLKGCESEEDSHDDEYESQPHSRPLTCPRRKAADIATERIASQINDGSV